MLTLSEYTFLECISLSASPALYRAERRQDKRRVLVKIVDSSTPHQPENPPLSREYELARRFAGPALARYLNLEVYQNKQLAILEDLEGLTLEKYLQAGCPDVASALKIAIGIARILAFYHQHGLVHQALCPAHLLIDPGTFQVRLIEFSLTSQVSCQHPAVAQPVLLPDALPYTAPEQTGRIKGEVDVRSDLYALGVMLYELLTGKRPFATTETLALIHCHIAQTPRPPHLYQPRVPPALSALVLKLLAKNAQDRYQSPFGLKADLQDCLAQWTRSGTVEAFALGRHDFSGRLQNHHHFYGRQSEVLALGEAFARVRRGAVETVLVEGYSGIGKSALVDQLREPVRAAGGLFVKGKFNQFQRNIPYFAFRQAFQQFTDFVLTQPWEQICGWKERIQQAVGANGGILTEVIPHLELLLGSQPAVPELEPNQAKNRFAYVLTNFVKAIARPEHPLVLFFDDLQWADAASSGLLKLIATDKDLQCLLFVGAYRDNEMGVNSSFSDTIAEIDKKGGQLQRLRLVPLPREDAAAILQASLHCPVREGERLLELVYRKSQGNPFFMKALLKCLYAENILFFDFAGFQWQWDEAKLNRLRYTDNIIDLMTGRIQQLPPATQQLLTVAACLGYEFNLHLLAVILGERQEVIAQTLKAALQEELVLPAGDHYRFSHDRIQQAAYSLIAPGEKKREHLRIGKALLAQLDPEARSTYIFEIVNQLNAGIAPTAAQEEKDQLAELNLAAGLKAKSSAAYKTAFDYLQTGIELLSPQAWQTHYALTLQLYIEGAESSFLSGNTPLMEQWVEVVLRNAATVLEKVRAYEIKIKFLIAQQKLLEAVRTSLHVLALLGVHFPEKPTKPYILAALLKIRIALLRKPADTLIDLPVTQNPSAEAAIRLLVSMGSAVYIAVPELLPLVSCKAFQIMLAHGNTPYSGVVCNGYALIIMAGFGDIDTGYRLGRIAIQLSEKFGTSSLKCQSRMMANTFVVHWKEHLKDTLEPLLHNYWYGLENGHTEFATYSAFIYCYSSFFCGRKLEEVTQESIRFYERLKQHKHESALNIHRIHTQAALNLYESVADPTVLTGRVHDEAEMMELYAETQVGTALFDLYLDKLMLSYIFERYDDAQRNAQAARLRLAGGAASPETIIFYFYDTLTDIALLPGCRGAARQRLLAKINRQRRLFGRYTRFAPMNCLHKLELIEAELCRVNGQFEKAALHYDEAFAQAQRNEYLNDAALVSELAGKCYLSRDRLPLARYYLQQAYGLYGQWNAFAKVKQLEGRYPFLREEPAPAPGLSHLPLPETPPGPAANLAAEKRLQRLDLHSILKAATAISGEIQLDQLLKKLVKIAVENAGARQGYLVLKKEQGFFIEAEGSFDSADEVIVQSVPLAGNGAVSEAIVQFVYATQENLVLDDVGEHAHFAADPVLSRKAAKSLLCMPILHQGKVIGLLYFENELITHAFTEEHTELLKLLSGQMAVSLQNALSEQKKIQDFLDREKLLTQINHQQKLAAKAILDTQHNERKRITEELHDGLGYLLSTLKLHLTALQESKQADESTKIMANSMRLLEDSFKELRQVSNNLMPDMLLQLGLVAALQDLCGKINRTGKLTVRFNAYHLNKKFRKEFEMEVYRMIQEITNNVLKHSGAKTFDIQLINDENKLTVTAEDDGKGFNYKKTLKSGKGRGLVNILNRVNYLQGSIRYDTSINKGTTVIIELPLHLD